MREKRTFLQRKTIVIIVILAVVGGYLVSRIFAASGAMSLVPSTPTVNIGSTVQVAIRINATDDTVNFVQANLTFDSTKLQYVSTSDASTSFPLVASNQAGTGTLEIARGTNGGTAPISGDALVSTVTFKALATGSTTVGLGAESIIVSSKTNKDILSIKNTANLVLVDSTAPTVPTALTANTITMTSVNLGWSASTDNVGVTAYRIYRNGAQVGSTSNTSYTDNGLTPATAYSYTVAALDAAGNVSGQSTAVSATTSADAQAPSTHGKPTSSSQTMTSITLI